MTRIPGDVQEAREAFGARLRELRQQASLTGRTLAQRTGLHFTKVSRIEHGKQSLTDAEIRAWCRACGVQHHADDLVAMARNADSLYREWHRQTQAGLRLLQETDTRSRYRQFRLLRVFEHTILPGLFHTASYSNELMAMWARFLGAPDDRVAATAVRLGRQKVLSSGVRRFAFVLAEQTLRSRITSPQRMVEQLDQLLELLTLPRVSIGIIPSAAELSFHSQTNFWIWDDTRVTIETTSARIEITRKDEIALYAAAFDLLRQSAVYGSQARGLITAARDQFRDLHKGSSG